MLTYNLPVLAADFTIVNGQTETTTQTLAANGDVGIVEQGGVISTTGNNVRGISASGLNTRITNFGSITTTGDNSFGIISGAASTNTIIQNSGSVSTAGNSTYGIVSSGANVTITNSGTVSTTGNIADAILSVGSNTAITNTGIITTTNGNSAGINSTGTNSRITNSGSISTTNGSAHGIFSQGTGSVVTNSGSISATGAGSKAISIAGNNTTVVLSAGSNLVGEIDFRATTGGKVTIDNTISAPKTGGGTAVKKAQISLPNITGTHTVETAKASVDGDIGNSVLVENDDTIAVISPDIFARADQAITQVAINSNNLVNNHLQQAHLGRNTGIAIASQVADTGIVFSDYSDIVNNPDLLIEPATAWIEGFGSYQERPDHNDASFSRARSGGIIGGIDLPTTEDGYTFGVYGGGFLAQLDLGEQNFREIKSKGMLVGAYASKEVNGINIDLQIATGVSFNESDRKVSTDIASAEYNSYFLSPSVTVSKPLSSQWGLIVPSFTLLYNGQYTENYEESGSIADQDVDAQYSNTISGRVMVEAELESINTNTGILKPTVRAGMDGQSSIGNRSTDLTVLNTNVSLEQKGSDQFVDGVVGLNFSYDFYDGAEIYVDSEINVGLTQGNIDDNFGASLRTGLRWNF